MAITVNQIAEKCGVSRTTVLRALNDNGRVSKETREKVLAIATEYNYRPNLLARSLNHGHTMSLGIVTINVENYYFVQSLNIINKEADKKGYFANIVVCEDNLDWEKKLIQGLADRQVDGIIISPINKGKEFECFLKSLNIPIVCIGNQISNSFTTVQVNEANAALDAFELIASKGYEKVYFVCPPLSSDKRKNIYTHEQRYIGFCEGANRNKRIATEIIDTQDYLSEVKKAINNLSGKKTAFLCSGDSYALNIMRMASALGLNIPSDLGIMGFDNINVLDFITPHLSTVSTNVEGVARIAVEELINQIENKDSEPRNILLNYEILDRETL